MKYALVLTSALLGAAGCKTSNANLSEDISFQNNNTGPDSKAYLTWVVGEKGSAGQPDTRQVCRAACDNDPATLAEELGKDKVAEVRSSCLRDTTQSVAFSDIESHKASQYQGAVTLADDLASFPNLSSLRNNAAGSEVQTLAMLMRIWQDNAYQSGPLKAAFSPTGVLNVDPRNNATMEEWSNVVDALFANNNLIHLDPAIRSARDAHDARQARLVETGILNPGQEALFDLQGAQRYSNSCYSSEPAGSGTTPDDSDEAEVETEEEISSTYTEEASTEPADASASAGAVIPELAYKYLQARFEDCLKEKPTSLTKVGEKTHKLVRESFYFSTMVDDTRAMNFIPKVNEQKVHSVTIQTSAEKTDINSTAFHNILNAWSYELKIPNVTAAPTKCTAEADGSIAFGAWTPHPRNRNAGPLTYSLGKVRFLSGNRVEFVDPAESLAEQTKRLLN